MRYAISDIHGCPKTLQRALELIDFSYSDELFLLGDYIDRGPDSQGVLDYVWQLEEESHDVICLRGNHEEMLLEAARGERMLYDWSPTRGDADRVFHWMDSLPFYHETPGYILTHAGLNFRMEDPLEDTQSMLWIRYFHGDINPDWLGNRILVHGHTPATAAQIKAGLNYAAVNKIACIDSGCSLTRKGFGYLTVLNLDTMTCTQVKRVDQYPIKDRFY
ncbi:MAG: metallophosphoesterase family protein [Bacteroidota bacterium]